MRSDVPARVETSDPTAPGADVALFREALVGYVKAALDELAVDGAAWDCCMLY